jgi:hypothetical protein
VIGRSLPFHRCILKCLLHTAICQSTNSMVLVPKQARHLPPTPGDPHLPTICKTKSPSAPRNEQLQICSEVHLIPIQMSIQSSLQPSRTIPLIPSIPPKPSTHTSTLPPRQAASHHLYLETCNVWTFQNPPAATSRSSALLN